MEHKVKKYEMPEDNQPAMVGESPVALQQYADDLRYGMEMLSTVSPEKLHHIVVFISDYTKDESDGASLSPKRWDEPNDVTKAAIFEARHLTKKSTSSIQPVDTSSVEAMLSSCGI